MNVIAFSPEFQKKIQKLGILTDILIVIAILGIIVTVYKSILEIKKVKLEINNLEK